MLYLKNAKYLEVKELPAREPYPATALVTLLVGASETLNLIGDLELLDALADVEPFADVSFELRHKRVPLAALGVPGAKGNVYRLRIVRLLEATEEVA